MKIVLYKNSAEKNVVDKSESLSKVCEIEGVFKSATSVTNPSVIFDNESSTFEEYSIIDSDSIIVCDAENAEISAMDYILNNLLSANYAYIEDLSRYYFIEDITVVTDRLFDISMKVDVLMSFNGEIRENGCIIERCSDPDFLPSAVEDNAYSFSLAKYINYWEPSENIPVNPKFPVKITKFTPFSSALNNNIILSYITADVIKEPNASYYSVMKNAIGGNLHTQYMVVDYAILDNVTNMLMNYGENAQYLKNASVYPFEITDFTETDDKSFIFGADYTTTGKLVTLPSGDTFKYPNLPILDVIAASFIKDFDTNPFDPLRFIEYPPYTTYEIYVPYYGYVQLDPDVFMGKLLQVTYSISCEDGKAIAFINLYRDQEWNELTKTYEWTDMITLWSDEVQLGIKPSLTTSNATNNALNNMTSTVTGTLNILSSALIAGAGFATGNPLMAIGGIAGGATSAVKTGIGILNNKVRSNTNIASSFEGIMSDQEVFMRVTSYEAYNSEEINLKKGHITNLYNSLDALEGFTVIDNSAHLSIPSATKSELDEIETLAKEGIIL